MKTSDGSFHQCFNGQALVDSEAQVIVACEVSDEAPDARQLEPALCQLDENLEAVDRELPEGAVLTADAGYFSEDASRRPPSMGSTGTSRTGRFKHSEPQPPGAERTAPKGRDGQAADDVQAEDEKGRAVYARRKAIVEPVFGQMDTVQTPAGCSYVASGPPAPSGASSARSTTCSNSTWQAEWHSSRQSEPLGGACRPRRVPLIAPRPASSSIPRPTTPPESASNRGQPRSFPLNAG